MRQKNSKPHICDMLSKCPTSKASMVTMKFRMALGKGRQTMKTKVGVKSTTEKSYPEKMGKCRNPESSFYVSFAWFCQMK